MARREKKLEPPPHITYNKRSRSVVDLSVKGRVKILETKIGVHFHDFGITKPTKINAVSLKRCVQEHS